jgi:post-segregation antitoxin (ccd killing protein)
MKQSSKERLFGNRQIPAKKIVNISIYEEVQNAARQIGMGNVSEGISEAVLNEMERRRNGN